MSEVETLDCKRIKDVVAGKVSLRDFWVRAIEIVERKLDQKKQKEET